MPSYTYYCEKCNKSFSIFSTIREYQEEVDCRYDSCKHTCSRYYKEDMLSISSSVRKSDSELKTLGDLANRNRDKMSKDQRVALDKKHTQYQDDKLKDELTKQLPKGMSRMKKPKNKIKWR